MENAKFKIINQQAEKKQNCVTSTLKSNDA
jgi:hypothetical protein